MAEVLNRLLLANHAIARFKVLQILISLSILLNILTLLEPIVAFLVAAMFRAWHFGISRAIWALSLQSVTRSGERLALEDALLMWVPDPILRLSLAGLLQIVCSLVVLLIFALGLWSFVLLSAIIDSLINKDIVRVVWMVRVLKF